MLSREAIEKPALSCNESKDSAVAVYWEGASMRWVVVEGRGKRPDNVCYIMVGTRVVNTRSIRLVK